MHDLLTDRLTDKVIRRGAILIFIISTIIYFQDNRRKDRGDSKRGGGEGTSSG